VRTVFFAKWTNIGDEWTFNIKADAFLYRMVRRLVYVQVAAGQGRLSSEELGWALNISPLSTPWVSKKGQNGIPASLAPASGLTLVEVRYDNLV
jgi:tRNA pseudouridine38-40 synthase